MYVMAVDPGDAHVGWAAWSPDHSIDTGELDAHQAVGFIDSALAVMGGSGRAVVLVLEEYVLYPHQAGAQSWSPMLTSEMIGALKHVAGERGAKVEEQGANIKKPTRAQLPARGLQLTGKGNHARDAETHLLHYLLKNHLVEERR